MKNNKPFYTRRQSRQEKRKEKREEDKKKKALEIKQQDPSTHPNTFRASSIFAGRLGQETLLTPEKINNIQDLSLKQTINEELANFEPGAEVRVGVLKPKMSRYELELVEGLKIAYQQGLVRVIPATIDGVKTNFMRLDISLSQLVRLTNDDPKKRISGRDLTLLYNALVAKSRNPYIYGGTISGVRKDTGKYEVARFFEQRHMVYDIGGKYGALNDDQLISVKFFINALLFDPAMAGYFVMPNNTMRLLKDAASGKRQDIQLAHNIIAHLTQIANRHNVHTGMFHFYGEGTTAVTARQLKEVAYQLPLDQIHKKYRKTRSWDRFDKTIDLLIENLKFITKYQGRDTKRHYREDATGSQYLDMTIDLDWHAKHDPLNKEKPLLNAD